MHHAAGCSALAMAAARGAALRQARQNEFVVTWATGIFDSESRPAFPYKTSLRSSGLKPCMSTCFDVPYQAPVPMPWEESARGLEHAV